MKPENLCQTYTITYNISNLVVNKEVGSCNCKDIDYCLNECEFGKQEEKCPLMPVSKLTLLVYLLIFLGCLGAYGIFIHFINQIIFK